MQGPDGEGSGPGERVAAAESKDEWRSQRPGEPCDHQVEVEAPPIVVHTLCAHDEYGLRGFKETDGGPDGGDPEPLRRLGTYVCRIHRENRIPRLGAQRNNAANCRIGAASGLDAVRSAGPYLSA